MGSFSKILMLSSVIVGGSLMSMPVEAAGGSRTFNGAYAGLTMGLAYNQIELKFSDATHSESVKKAKKSMPVGFHLGAGATTKKKIYLGAELGLEYEGAGKAQLANPKTFPGFDLSSTYEKSLSMAINGKFGYNTGKLLPYITLGAIMSFWKVNLSAAQQGNKKMLPGILIGGGLGYQWNKSIITSAEYRYSIYQKQKWGFKIANSNFKFLGDPASHNLLLKLSFVLG